ncbi:MAG: flotillin domain-containing protein [Candidatus Pseudothioglobus sp.]|nr:flotillin family protein [Candidatus Thioglobus sp.]MDC0181326.1 SPFH domain-containing protein [Candidatus Thioglobus sp.]|tara:strand:+ start:8198 stop:10195 length:1998 start_codon:yes stop_codon:yes gene_type:complete
MTGADIIATIILTALAIAIFVYLLHWLYRRSSKEVSFVRTGLRGEKVVISGGAFVLPIIHNITSVGMRTLRIEVKRGGDKSFITKNRMRVEIVAEFYVRVTPNKEAVSIAAGTLGKRTMEPESLRDLVQGRFVDALGIVAAQMSMEEIQEQRGAYIKAVKDIVAESLGSTGLELEAVSLTSVDQAGLEVFDPSNAFDAEGLTQLTEQIEAGKKKRNDIEQDTSIRIRSKNLEAEQKALEIDQDREFSRLLQEREIAKQRDKERTEMAIETARQERLAEEARIKAEEDIEKTRIQQQDTIEVERSLREHELTLQIEERKKLRNEIERQTEIDIKEKNLEAEIRSLEIKKENEFARLKQEEEIASQRARQKAEVLKVESDKYIEAEQAQIKAQEEVKKLQIEQQRIIEVTRIENDQQAQASEIKKRKNLEIEEKDRELEVIAKTVEVLSAVEDKEHARAQAVVAEEQVLSAQEVEVAERDKKLQLINAEKEGESEAIQITTLARAEKEAAQEREQAEKHTSLASKLRYEIDAAGKLMLNEAENVRSDESRQSDLRMELARNLDSIIREAVKPMENIDDIKIYELNGMPGFNSNSANSDFVGPVSNDGGGLPENIVNAAMRYRAQVPFIDNLLDEIGMSPKEISNIKNLLGDYKKDEKKDDDIEGEIS